MPPFDSFPFQKKQEKQKPTRQSRDGERTQPTFQLPKEASLYGEAWGDPPGTTAESLAEQMQQERQPQRQQNPWGNLSDLNDTPSQPQRPRQTPPPQRQQNPWGNVSDLNNTPNQNQNFGQPQERPQPQRQQNPWGSLSDLNDTPNQQQRPRQTPPPMPQKSPEELSFEELHKNAQRKLMGTTLPNESQNQNISMAERKKILSQPIDIDKIIAQTSGTASPAPQEPKMNSKESLQALLLNTPQKSQEPQQPRITQPQFERISTQPEPQQPTITQPQFERISTQPEPQQLTITQPQFERISTQPEPQQPTITQPQPEPQQAPASALVHDAPVIAPQQKRASFGGLLNDETDAPSMAPPKRTATFGILGDEPEQPIYQTKAPKKKSPLGILGKSKKGKQDAPVKTTEFQLSGQGKGLLSEIMDSADYVPNEPSPNENQGFHAPLHSESHVQNEPLLSENSVQYTPPTDEIITPSAQPQTMSQPQMISNSVDEPEKNADITAYVDRVGSFIRWRKARRLIRQELEDHIYDQRDYYIGEGDLEADATYEAILQMGDAELVGRQYNATHRPKEQAIIGGALAFLFVFGLYMQLFLLQTQFEPSYKEFFYHGAALLAFLIGYLTDFSLLGKYARWLTPPLLIFPAILLGIQTLNLFDFAEIFRAYATFVFPLAYALLIYATQKTGHRGLILCLLGYLYLCGLLFFYEMHANILFFSCIAFILLHYAVSRRWYGVNRKRTFTIMIALATGLIAVAVTFINRNPDLLDRIRIVFYPSIDPIESGYLYITLQNVIASCKLLTPTSSLDPQIAYTLINDFPLTYLATKAGLWVLLAALTPIAIFLAMATIDLQKQKTIIGGLLLLAVGLPIAFQCLTFILNATGRLIIDSYFPMISYGLFGHIFAFGGLGIASSVSRIGYLCQDTKRKFAL